MISIRNDISAGDLRRAAKTVESREARPFLALADVLDGMTRSGAAAKVGASSSTLTKWIYVLNTEGVKGLQDLSSVHASGYVRPTPIRGDISAGDLWRAAKTVDGFAARRLFALADVLDGMTRKEAARQANIARGSVAMGICVLNAKGIKGLLEFLRGWTRACPMRDDISAGDLRQAAETVDNRTGRRYLAIADVLDGMLRKDAAKAANIPRNTLRRWILRFNAEGLEGLQECWPGQWRTSVLRIRDDISARDLRRAAKTVDRRVTQRFSAIADALDGMIPRDAATKVGASPLTMADWIRQFNAGGIEGLQDLSPGPAWPIPIRDDISAGDLRRAAKTLDRRAAQRFSVIADVLDGMGRGEAARKAKIEGQTLVIWISRFNAHGIEGLRSTNMRAGRPSTLRIRDDVSAKRLRLAANNVGGRAARRYLAIADVLDGMDRKEAAAKVGAKPSSMTAWIKWLNADNGHSKPGVASGRRAPS